jgi:hypothetical protein
VYRAHCGVVVLFEKKLGRGVKDESQIEDHRDLDRVPVPGLRAAV